MVRFFNQLSKKEQEYIAEKIRNRMRRQGIFTEKAIREYTPSEFFCVEKCTCGRILEEKEVISENITLNGFARKIIYICKKCKRKTVTYRSGE